MVALEQLRTRFAIRPNLSMREFIPRDDFRQWFAELTSVVFLSNEFGYCGISNQSKNFVDHFG